MRTMAILSLGLVVLVLSGCEGGREEADGSESVADGSAVTLNEPNLAPAVVFHGLDLSAAPQTIRMNELPELFAELSRSPHATAFALRQGVECVYAGADGAVYYLPAEQRFYVAYDPGEPNFVTYYGPFAGDPAEAMSLETPAAADGLDPSVGVRPRALVDPLLELDGLIQAYRRQENPQADAELAALRQQYAEGRAAGGSLWGSKEWMASPEYYQDLDTETLILECFSRSIFGFETTIFDDPRVGIERLRAYHDGFAELFERDDLWRGVLHLYADLTAKIDPNADMTQIVRTSGLFNSLHTLYLYTPLRDQIKGREPLFLQANLEAVRKYVWYLDNYDRQQDSPGFFREPVQVLQMALLLTAEIDPAKYAKARAELGKTLWTQEQEPEKLRSFLALGVELLE